MSEDRRLLLAAFPIPVEGTVHSVAADRAASLEKVRHQVHLFFICSSYCGLLLFTMSHCISK